MSSRADFLASLGISNDDMVNPDEQQNPAPPSRTKSGGGSSLLINRERSDPSLGHASTIPGKSSAYSTHKASPVKATSYSGTSAILSMARDDSDDDEDVYRAKPKASASSVRNATGSQEVSAAPAPPPRATSGGYSGEYSSQPSAYSSSSSTATRQQQQPQRQTSTMSSGSFNTSSSGLNLGAGRSASNSAEESSSPSAAKMTRAEKAKEAESQKLAGNALFGEREYRKAVRCYSKAIEMDPSNAALYSNRSAAYLAGRDQMGIDTRSMALRDATRATELRPDWAKGYCRQAEALTELESFEEAAEAWTKALEYDPGNRNFEQRRAEVESRFGPVKRTASSLNTNIPVVPKRTSSNSSMNYANPSGESARVLAQRFHEQSGTLSGGDFRAEELERARQRRSGNSFTSSSSANTPTATSGSNPTNVGGVSGLGSSGYFSAARSVPQEYSTDAAREYQNSLLEAYRKKKAAQGK